MQGERGKYGAPLAHLAVVELALEVGAGDHYRMKPVTLAEEPSVAAGSYGI